MRCDLFWIIQAQLHELKTMGNKMYKRQRNKQFLEERLTRQHFSKSLCCEVKSQDIKATEVTKMKEPGEQSSTGVFQQVEEAKVTLVQARGCSRFSKG